MNDKRQEFYGILFSLAVVGNILRAEFCLSPASPPPPLYFKATVGVFSSYNPVVACLRASVPDLCNSIDMRQHVSSVSLLFGKHLLIANPLRMLVAVCCFGPCTHAVGAVDDFLFRSVPFLPRVLAGKVASFRRHPLSCFFFVQLPHPPPPPPSQPPS